MVSRYTLVYSLLLALVLSVSLSPVAARDFTAPVLPSQPDILASYGNLPLYFEANQGQVADTVNFVARGQGYTLYLSEQAAVFSLAQTVEDTARQTHTLTMTLPGANPAPTITGRELLASRSNYFIGNDPAQWRTNVEHYARVQYEDVYPDIDLVYYGNQSQLQYDFILAPGADPGQIGLQFPEADALEIEDISGDLLIHLGGEVVRQHAPFSYQEVDGAKVEVQSAFKLDGDIVRFILGAYDAARPLVIDPVLVYSSYVGGDQTDWMRDIALDSAGNFYLIGSTGGLNFAMSPDAYDATPELGNQDIFLLKFNPAGNTLLYGTYLGGLSLEEIGAAQVTSSGDIYLTGWTSSSNFPTLNAYQPVQPDTNGWADAIVAKFDGSGSLVYSTYLGGNNLDRGQDIAVDSSGAAYITGFTRSLNFPTQNAFRGTLIGSSSSFLTKLSASGNALVYSTYVGSGEGYAVTVDGNGSAYITGVTDLGTFPTTPGAYDTSYNGNFDTYITKFAPDGTGLVFSTFLGGSQTDGTWGGGTIVLDGGGNVYVTGVTGSADFPQFGGYSTSFHGAGQNDIYLAKLNASGSSLIYSTFFGGIYSDSPSALLVDADGNAYIAGDTGSPDFPVVDPYQPTLAGGNDAFLTQFNASGSAILSSTYIGGSLGETIAGMVLAPDGSLWLAGSTQSTDLPMINPYQGTHQGIGFNQDGFVMKFGTPPPGLVVNTTADDPDLTLDGSCWTAAGKCSLRAAIQEANSIPGTDTISFDIPSGGAKTIMLLSALPTITEPVIIDATTQPGFAGQPIIEINGAGVPALSSGFHITAGNSTIRGFVLNSFISHAIWLSGNGGNAIEGSYIGLDLSGTVSTGNNNANWGIYIDNSPANQIGGSTAAQRNVISGSHVGIVINGAASTSNIIQGNYIGTDFTGTIDVTVPSGIEIGINIALGATNTVIGGTGAGQGNLIGGLDDGVYLNGSGSIVQGNIIGLNASGTASLANAQQGILIGSPNTLIGGTVPGARNIISGNGVGIRVGSNTAGSQVQGNYIGTNLTGMSAIPNSTGISVTGLNTTIGGSTAAARNVIAGNNLNVFVMGDATGIQISGNYIGLAVDGVTPMTSGTDLIQLYDASNLMLGGASAEGNVIAGNAAFGIRLRVNSTNNTIQGNYIGTDASGTVAAGSVSNAIAIENSTNNLVSNNLIAYGSGPSITLFPGSTGNRISQNSLFSNFFGIDLNANGVTLNDLNDVDTGSNNLQNFPELTSAYFNGTETVISGMLNSTASTSFELEFFSSPTCHASGYGEGKTFLGATTATTDGSGNASFSLSVTAVIGETITATATDPGNNTSEFSQCLVVQPQPVSGTVAFSTTSSSAAEDAGTQNIEATLTVFPGTALPSPIVVETVLSGTATAGADYTASTTFINFVQAGGFTAGTYTAVLPITLIDDSVSEPNEVLIIDMTVASGVTLGSQTRYSLIITDNDSATAEPTPAPTQPTPEPLPLCSKDGLQALINQIANDGVRNAFNEHLRTENYQAIAIQAAGTSPSQLPNDLANQIIAIANCLREVQLAQAAGLQPGQFILVTASNLPRDGQARLLSTPGEEIELTIPFQNPKSKPLTQVVITASFDRRLEDMEIVSYTIGQAITTPNMVTLLNFILQPRQVEQLVVRVRIAETVQPGEVLSVLVSLESPDASIHVEQLEILVVPGRLPATGETPIWQREMITLVGVLVVLAVLGGRLLYRRSGL